MTMNEMANDISTCLCPICTKDTKLPIDIKPSHERILVERHQNNKEEEIIIRKE